jgi:polar amino acid transport system substrate-binding protein
MKKLLTLVTVTLIVLLSACTEGDNVNSLEAVVNQGYMVLGLDDTFAPLGFRDEDGNVVGFDIDLANAVATEMGVELRIQSIEWDSKVLELNAGNIDMIWNGLSITEDRKEKINFSLPYLNNKQIVLIKSGKSLQSITDLSGLTVGVQFDSSGELALNENDIVDKVDEVVRFNTFTEALLDLDSERIDLIIIDEIMARYVVSKGTYDVVVSDVSLGSEAYGIGFRIGDNELRDEIDRILLELQDSGKAAEISIKWFGKDVFQK